MYPLTKEFPKPLLPIAKRPILDYIALKVAAVKELEAIIVITNDKYYPHFLDWAKKAASYIPLSIKVINDGTKNEEGRLGAIGDINFALGQEAFGSGDAALIFGGDNLFQESLDGFMDFARRKAPQASIGLYDIGKKELASKYGVVQLGQKSEIIDFAEKPRAPQSSLIATCLYYIPYEKLSSFKEYTQGFKNEKDASGSFISWLSKKEKVYGYVFKKHWYDIGDPQSYQEADEVFANLEKEKGDGKA